MTSADAIDQEILNDLRNGKKVEPKPELKPIVDAVVNASLEKAKEIMEADGKATAKYYEEHPEELFKGEIKIYRDTFVKGEDPVLLKFKR